MCTLMFATSVYRTHLTCMVFKKNWRKNKWWILTFLLAWPPPSTPQGGFLGQLAGVILGGSPCKLTWQVNLTSCHLSSHEEGLEARVTSQLDERNLSSWLVKFHLRKNASVGPWKCWHHDGDTSRYQEIQFRYRSVRKCLKNSPATRVGPTGTWPDYLVNRADHKKWGAIRRKKLHRNREIIVQWMVGVVGVYGQLTQGTNLRNPRTKYKRSKNVISVTSIALRCGRVWPRLLQPLVQSLIGSSGTFPATGVRPGMRKINWKK